MRENFNIFIVEDDVWYIKILTHYLRHLESLPQMKNYKLNLIPFNSGEECIKEMHQEPEVILLDYYLDSGTKKTENGLSILKKIRKIRKKIPVIMLSGQKELITTTELMKAGATEYVSKEGHGMQRVAALLQNVISQKFSAKSKNKTRSRILFFVLITLFALSVLYYNL